MSESKPDKPKPTKAKIAVLVTLICGVAGFGLWQFLPGAVASPPPPPQAQPAATFTPPQTEAPILDRAPPVQPPEITAIVPFTASGEAEQMLKYSRQQNLQRIRQQALIAQKKADDAKAALDNPPRPLHRVGDDIPVPVDINLPQPALTDQLVIKSLVRTKHGVRGWVSLGNELIPIRKGTAIGTIVVESINENQVRFRENGKIITRWISQAALVPVRQDKEDS